MPTSRQRVEWPPLVSAPCYPHKLAVTLSACSPILAGNCAAIDEAPLGVTPERAFFKGPGRRF